MRILIGIIIGIVIADIGTEKVFDFIGNTLQRFVNFIQSFV